MHWGIAALIVLLIAAGGFIYWQWSSVQQFKEELAQDDKWLEEENKPVAKNDLPPADPGKKWVPHGDHFHQVPIDAPDEWQDEPHDTPTVKEVSVGVQEASVDALQGSTQNAAWVEWSKKYNELSKAFLQVSASDVLPSTEDELKRFETDEQYRKEVQRKYSEALQKSAKIYTRMKALEKENPLLEVNR